MAVALAAVAVAAPSPAAAKPRHIVFPGGLESEFSIRGTNGYELTIAHIRKRVELYASKGDASAIYLVRAPRPSGDGTIEATLPGVGRISVRFEPSGPARRSPPFFPPGAGCSGGGEVKQRGTFRGTIRFAGEQSFTRVSTGSARGFTRVVTREVCKGGSNGKAVRGVRGYSLTSLARSRGRQVFFGATRETSEDVIRGDTSYWAQAYERRRGMQIVRIALVHAGPATFAVAGPPARPSSASVAPPAPFRGTATFDATLDTPTWEGSLAIDLPGASGLQLTGPAFSSRLCHNRLCRGDLSSR